MTATALLGDRYALRDQLGAGGTAVVWRAHDSVLGREVAVKLLAARHAGDPESRQRIRAEARAAAALSHPNIAQVYDYGEFDGMPYVVMELVRGGTLQQRMLAGLVPPRFAMRVTAEIAAALAAAHAEGLVHRDIKPANVMLAPTGAKVVDFGIAAAVHPGGTGADFEVFGTPAYLAPERLVDDAVTPASDVYALGVLLYRLLSGHSPWSADTTTQMLTAHVYLDPEPLLPQSGVPGYVTDLCNRCLAKDSTERPSAREVAALLAQGAGVRVVEDAPAHPVVAPAVVAPAVLAPSGRGAASAASDQPERPEPGPPARRRHLVPVVAAAVLLAAGAAGWLVVHDDDQNAPATAPPVAAPPPARDTATSPPARNTATPPPVAPAKPDATAPIRPAPAGTAPKKPRATGATRTTPATRTATSTGPVLRTATFISAGGTVNAVCTAPDTAEILSWKPAKPYKLDEIEAGPSAAPSCVFRHGNDRVRMTVTCSGGVPTRS